MERSFRLDLALMLVLGTIAFAPTLRTGFLWDDHEMIVKNDHIKSVSFANVRRAFLHDVFDRKGDAYFRPLQTLMNMVDHWMWGLRPFGYHLTNLIFHLIAAGFLLLVLRKTFPSQLTVAWMASAFFAVHPIVVEQLLIIAGRAEIMAAAFTFITVWLAGSSRPGVRAASVLSFALACLSKESGIVAPLFLFLAGLASPTFRVKWPVYAMYGAVLAGYLTLRQSVLPHSVPMPSVLEWVLFLARELPTIFGTYVRILLVPTDLHSHRRMLFETQWMFLSPILIFFIVAWAFIRRSARLWLGLAWFIAGFLPKLPLLATNSLMLDHWAYVSAIGVWLWIAEGLSWIEKWKGPSVSRAIFWTICVGWIALGWVNISRRNTDKKLYDWALRYPSSSIVRSNRGLIYYQEGDFAGAERLLRASLKINPNSPGVWNILALTLWKSGRPADAISILNQILATTPEHVQSRLNRGLILGGREGLADVDAVLSKEPENTSARAIRESIVSKNSGR